MNGNHSSNLDKYYNNISDQNQKKITSPKLKQIKDLNKSLNSSQNLNKQS